MSWFKRVLLGDPRTGAAKEGDITRMQELLDQGMDINGTTWPSDPALFYAAAWGKAAMVDFLIKNGADVDYYTNSRQQTPLMQAAHYGHTEVVKLLIEKGANVNARNKSGESPLDVARRPVAFSDYPIKAIDKESCAAVIRQAGGKSTLPTA